MDDGGQRENGRHKPDQYKAVHSQWMMPPHQMKEQHALTMKQILAIMSERDAAIQDRNLAIAEKKAAVSERDVVILQRDAAIAERNSAIMERDNALAALEYREDAMNGCGGPTSTPGCSVPRGTKHMHHHHHHQPHLAESPYQAIPISAASASEVVKPLRAKRMRKETQTMSLKGSSKSPRSRKKGEDLNKVTIAKTNEWMNGHDTGGGGGEDRNKPQAFPNPDWKGHDLGLNQVTFDDSTMPVPVCSCTGVFQQCYKWGNGGWQSACCTTKLSMYPLPAMPNRRHARVGGRKMSGSVFIKLLSRLAAEGHDLSTPLDLKDHWARHGTNRYITIK